jgi:uncharacterized protein YndB with AHSA1/START domain
MTSGPDATRRSTTTHSDQADCGTLERRGELAVLRYRRRLPHPRPKVWRALAEPEQLAAWFPTTLEGDRSAGSPLRFAFRDMEIEPMSGEMLAFDPPALMELRWGDDTLRFELHEEGVTTVLDFTVTFPEYGKAARDGAGWHVCLDQLQHALDQTEPPWVQADRWRAVHPTYVQTLGAEASSIGPPPEWEEAHGPA